MKTNTISVISVRIRSVYIPTCSHGGAPLRRQPAGRRRPSTAQESRVAHALHGAGCQGGTRTRPCRPSMASHPVGTTHAAMGRRRSHPPGGHWVSDSMARTGGRWPSSYGEGAASKQSSDVFFRLTFFAEATFRVEGRQVDVRS